MILKGLNPIRSGYKSDNSLKNRLKGFHNRCATHASTKEPLFL